ncbi:DMT family transporter [Alteraurantiacibacter aquimixticola]|uniref:DMT family transporter n=1 Tax=Alteraurantiacibacter aquimixticola TaxID=2489173 RepID=A0A4T3F9Y5_9SPHN|nr:DMT family transporter [Alteraurantiacibacter aquimixticola]TIX51840.1 DMT family transporter [Alteraurantiacibacter aquimixticola]
MISDSRAGLLAAIAGFALFSIGDTITKSMAGAWSPLAVAALRFTMGALVLGTVLARAEGRKAFIPTRPWLQVARGASLGLATVCFFTAVFIMPLATAISIAFFAPAITALLSKPLLGETVRPLTWLAIAIAFSGVLVILQPNVVTLGWPALLPLGTALGMSLLVITNRAAAGQGSVLSMQFFVAAGSAAILLVVSLAGGASGIAMFALGWPDWTVVVRCAMVAVTGTTGHWLIYYGTTRAGAAHVAPATYIQLITASALGWLAFGDIPSLATLAGALIIVGAGMILWWDGRLLASTRQR